MAAKKDNKYAEKWTKQVVLDHLTQILQKVKTDKIFYLGVALAELDLYHQVWSEWTKKFETDKQVSDTIKRIEGLIEANILQLAGSNKMNTAIAIFVLKNKYKWSDKHEVDHTSKGESIVWNEVKTYDNGKDSE
ncbi:DNA-packaging protein gp3 [Pedobacter sp. ok626]|uniref:terminase small subunit n=1 Tax=Pedobacter sp. ok626 TaxID=1761882 RepID=UPI000885FE07|nr:terminase small subunit [Pedobacter sp. ok626]SDJ95522.1 DNA-packaging protein gp3 [Pedobacter sp. ok626]